MTENKRFTIKPQDDLFGVVDNCSADKVCVINGIRTEIEAKWLCNDMNALNDENKQLHRVIEENEQLKSKYSEQCTQLDFLKDENKHMRNLIIENKQLKQQIKDLRLSVLDSIHEAEEIQCCCNPCVIEECVKKVIE